MASSKAYNIADAVRRDMRVRGRRLILSPEVGESGSVGESATGICDCRCGLYSALVGVCDEDEGDDEDKMVMALKVVVVVVVVVLGKEEIKGGW
jgi:hypothetical protein